MHSLAVWSHFTFLVGLLQMGFRGHTQASVVLYTEAEGPSSSLLTRVPPLSIWGLVMNAEVLSLVSLARRCGGLSTRVLASQAVIHSECRVANSWENCLCACHVSKFRFCYLPALLSSWVSLDNVFLFFFWGGLFGEILFRVYCRYQWQSWSVMACFTIPEVKLGGIFGNLTYVWVFIFFLCCYLFLTLLYFIKSVGLYGF